MKKTFIPRMVLLSGTIDVGQSGNWSSGTEVTPTDTWYIDPQGVIWMYDDGIWTDGEGHEYSTPQTDELGWIVYEP